MTLEEELSGIESELRLVAECLRECADLAGVEPEALTALSVGAVHFSLPAGSFLYEIGAAAEGVYLLVSGRLGVRTPRHTPWAIEIERGELVGESAWLLKEPRSAAVLALRDSELIMLPNEVLDGVAATSTRFSLALARLCSRRLRNSVLADHTPKRARVFVVVPNSAELDVLELAGRLVAELSRSGSAELVWDVRAGTHTSGWFSRIEEFNDYVVYVSDPTETGWTRQCCRQADVILLAAPANAPVSPWLKGLCDVTQKRGARVEVALVHQQGFVAGAATRWRAALDVALHHHLVDDADMSRLVRLLTRRGVGLVLSGGGARGFAHLGIIRALREAHVPVDFIGGASIGGVIAAGVAMGWDDAEMRMRYRRSFVDTNPVNDYTIPRIALTRGRKATRLLEREYGDVLIEDLRQPFFCVSANLTTGRILEHKAGRLSAALRASVSIPGVLPPVIRDDEVLVDGAAINNLPVDIMRNYAPGLVIGCDVGADRNRGDGRYNIFQILMYAGMVNSAAGAAAQRALADVLLKPPLGNIDLLNFQAFDGAIEAGYAYARAALEGLPGIARLVPPRAAPAAPAKSVAPASPAESAPPASTAESASPAAPATTGAAGWPAAPPSPAPPD